MDRNKGVDPAAAAAARDMGDPGAKGSSKKKDMLEGAEGFEEQEKKLAPPDAKEPGKATGMA
jgi:hypothetical protein